MQNREGVPLEIFIAHLSTGIMVPTFSTRIPGGMCGARWCIARRGESRRRRLSGIRQLGLARRMPDAERQMGRTQARVSRYVCASSRPMQGKASFHCVSAASPGIAFRALCSSTGDISSARCGTRQWVIGHAHAKSATRGATSRATTRVFSVSRVKRLFVLAEEVVVGSVRHKRLIAHIGRGGATVSVSGGRSPFGV